MDIGCGVKKNGIFCHSELVLGKNAGRQLSVVS